MFLTILLPFLVFAGNDAGKGGFKYVFLVFAGNKAWKGGFKYVLNNSYKQSIYFSY